jgi:hypothetical protein
MVMGHYDSGSVWGGIEERLFTKLKLVLVDPAVADGSARGGRVQGHDHGALELIDTVSLSRNMLPI